ncbi:MAG: Crp/Fnr family transcriptional regulator, partial [Bacteroidota bacterium]
RKKLLAQPHQMVDKVFFMKNGIVRHYVKRDSRQFTKNFIKGPLFMIPSLTNFFLETPSRIYCETLSEINAVEWARKDLFNFADHHPNLYRFMLKGVTKAFHKKELKEIAHNELDAQNRYLNFLQEFPTLAHEIPAQYIASYLGIRPETLSRIRAKCIS